jgi:hypothetical protein
MKGWNYRIVRYWNGEGSDRAYGLHEVHYDANGVEIAMTASPATFSSDTYDAQQELSPGLDYNIDGEAAAVQEIIRSLERALADARRHPVFAEPERWAKQGRADFGDEK